MTAFTRLALVGFIASAAAFGQWLNYPTAGIPRTPDGKPDLAAPVPRTVDGHPGISGIWRFDTSAYSADITADLAPNEVNAWVDALYKQRIQGTRRDSPSVRCLPSGPELDTSGLFPMKIVQAPSLTLFLYESPTIYRQIFVDGRALPPDPNPAWMGYSIGHWDGNTFVVESSGLNDRTYLDHSGHPHTEALRITERFRRRDFGHLQVEVTLNDPAAYTRSWTVTMTATLLPDTEILESVCENERDSVHLVGLDLEPKLDREVLATYVGIYEVTAGRNMVVSLEGDRLMLQLDDVPGKFALVAQSKDSFVVQATGNTLEFTKGSDGAIEKVATGGVFRSTVGLRKKR